MIENVEKISEITGLKKLDSIRQLEFLETHYKVRPSVVGLGISLVVIILTLFGIVNSLVMFVVGFLIPSYFTLRSISSKGGNDDIKYLVYWVVYAISESFTPMITVFIPSTYWLILRVVGTVLLLHPKVQGATTIYYQVIEPSVYKLQSKMDKLFLEQRSPRSSNYT